MGDGTVFAGGVHALEDEEQGVLLAGVEDLLEFGELAQVLLGDRCGGFLALVATDGCGLKWARRTLVWGLMSQGDLNFIFASCWLEID